jgi:hypothetical protein
LVTVAGSTRNRSAISLRDKPSPHASTIRHRNANACDDFARRDHRTNVSRSCSVNTNSAIGRPIRAIDPP